jgi:type IV pilus assembly protein PilB
MAKKTPSKKAPTNSENASSESMMDILNQDLSWDTIRKFLTIEIPSPFINHHSELDLKEDQMSDERLRAYRASKAHVGDTFGDYLVDRGIITPEQLREAQGFREKTDQPLWRTLLHLRMITPQKLAKLLRLDFPIGTLPENNFTQFLTRKRIVKKRDLKLAWKTAQEKKVHFLDYMREEGIATDENIAEALANQLNLPYESLEGIDEIPEVALDQVPYHFPFRYHAIPYKFEDDVLYVAFADGDNIVEMEGMGILFDFEIQPVIAPKSTLDKLLKAYAPQLDADTAEEEGRQYGLQNEITDKPAPQLLDIILKGVLRRDGSDIHFEPQKGFYRIRFRVDGILHDVLTLPREIARKVLNQVKTLAELDTRNPMIPHDGHLVIVMDDRDMNFRVSVLPTPDGEKMVLRVVKMHFAFSRFEQLGMELAHRKYMDTLMKLPSGLILVAGPVGCGKTTTIYSCMNCLNPFTQNIMTIEDPVEYKLVGTTQAQVNHKVDMSFAVGLKAVLRQDPDIIMVGEIRDEETAGVAVSAALTGQKVFSTIHANSAPNACTALQFLGIRPTLLGHALAGIVFQKIVRKNCPHCSREMEADASLRKVINWPKDKPLKIRQGSGCTTCMHTGFHGRTAVFEILIPNDSFKNSLAHSPTQEELNKAAQKSGILTLHDHAVELLTRGVISGSELERIL